MNKCCEKCGNSKGERGKNANAKKILFVGAEVMPFAATGGLGDVMGSLPEALNERGNGEVEVRVVMPLHGAVGDRWRREMKDVYQKTVRLAWRQQYCGVKSLEKDGVIYYFVDNEYYYNRPSLYGYPDDGERYAFFCMAALDLIKETGFYPDVLHAHDWQAALSVVYLNAFFRKIPTYAQIRTVFTIHNIAYQGIYDAGILWDVFALPEEMRQVMEHGGAIDLMKGAIELCDRLSTVSPRYAEEIRTGEYSHGLHEVLRRNAHKTCGILNGIDYRYYDPARDRSIAVSYTSEDLRGKTFCKEALQRECGLEVRADAPLVAIVSRLVAHKGIDLVSEIAHRLLSSTDIQFVVLGIGDKRYEDLFRELEASFPHRVRALIEYDRDRSKRIYAGADIFLMPSKSEPCGLAQMIASRYGAVPVTRETGGLYDSIKQYGEKDGVLFGNGFTFPGYSSMELDAAVRAALALYESPEKWTRLVKRVMETDFSWGRSAERYLAMYGEL